MSKNDSSIVRGTFHDATTLHENSGRDQGRLMLLAITEGQVWTFELPSKGAVSVGRSSACEVRIDIPAISRRHCVLHLGSRMLVEDLGSANGTRVRGIKLDAGEMISIAPGDPIELGSTLLILQRQTNSSRPRRVWSHGYFEGRLEDECGRSERSRVPFSVMRIRVQGDDEGKAARLLLPLLKAGDVLATYAPGDYEALITESAGDSARRLLAQIELRLKHGGINVSAGVASFPKDGRSPEELLAKACAGLDGETQQAEMLVTDPKLERLVSVADRVAEGSLPVLLIGETGVGKDLVARRIHQRSPRSDGPFIRLSCASLAEPGMESKMFGSNGEVGWLDSAEGGTLVLDEIADLPMSLQALLAGPIGEGEIMEPGTSKPRTLNIRFVATTNRDLAKEVDQGTFREDLFFRLSAATLVVPPLRERIGDIGPLAQMFVTQACAAGGREPLLITPEAMGVLEAYGWPGNVRELKNTIERAVILAGDEPITPETLPLDKMWNVMPSADTSSDTDDDDDSPESLRARRTAYEKQVIIDALRRSGGNQTKAAKLLGIARRTLISRIEAYDLPRPRKGKRKSDS